MIAVSVKDLRKSYGVDEIFKNVSFTIEIGEKVAVVGQNGAGKTTLFNIIAGLDGKDSGEIIIPKDIKIAYMQQNVNIVSDKNIYDYVLEVFSYQIELEKEIEKLHEEIGAAKDEKKLETLYDIYAKKTEEFSENNGYAYSSLVKGALIGLGFSEADMDKTVDMLSGGEKSRLLLAKMLLSDSDLLLLDEPTNHLDMDSVVWLENYLSQQKKTVLVISHDRFFLDNLTTKTIDMENKTAEVFNFPYSKYVQKKQELYLKKLKDYLSDKQEIQRQKEIIEKLRSFGREKQIKRARSREKLLEKLPEPEKPTNSKTIKNIFFTSKIKSGNDVLKAENISKAFDEKQLFRNGNFAIYRGEKVALIGANGSGKTTLFNIIMEKERLDSGSISIGANVHIEYFSQEREDLNLKNTVFQEIQDAYPYLNNTMIRNYLAAFLFTGDDVFKEISLLSGGEKSRISLLKIMLSDANFILMDEPTNHLDIMSREVLENAIISSDMTVFVISHDRYFLNKVPDKILALENGDINEYHGNFTYMTEKKRAIAEIKEYGEIKEEETRTQREIRKKKTKEEKQKISSLKKEEKNITSKIEQTEEAIKTLDKKLCEEEVYTNPELTKQIVYEKKDLEESLQRLYADWEEINMLLEEI